MISPPPDPLDFRGGRHAYDTVAEDYATYLPDTRAEAPLDLAMIDAFADAVTSGDDDIAAVIHGRVTKWLATAGEQRQPDRIVGLFPAPRQVTDQDVDRALQERRTLIETNVRTLVLEALQSRDSWIQRFGRPPEDPVRREEWLRGLDTIAAYRDRWQVRGNAILGAEPRTREQMAQWLAGKRALTAAQAAVRTVNSSGNVPEERQGLEPGIP